MQNSNGNLERSSSPIQKCVIGIKIHSEIGKLNIYEKYSIVMNIFTVFLDGLHSSNTPMLRVKHTNHSKSL